ncbi:hypothetical protein DSECCO2_477160 [anaerobic digester metagenome]
MVPSPFNTTVAPAALRSDIESTVNSKFAGTISTTVPVAIALIVSAKVLYICCILSETLTPEKIGEYASE